MKPLAEVKRKFAGKVVLFVCEDFRSGRRAAYDFLKQLCAG